MMLHATFANSSSRFRTLVSLCFLLVLATLTNAQNNNDLSWVPFDRTQFNGSTTLDDKGDVQLFWKTGNEYSTFGIASRSNGYLALGFSQTGAMTGGDIAVGYMDTGEFVFENRYATGFVTPELSPDQKKNMRFIEGHQENGVTAFTFEKKNKAECLETQQEVAIDAWQWMIYSHSDENVFAQHGPNDNGKQYIKLGTGTTVSVNDVRPIADTKSFTIVAGEVDIPTAETTYCYTLHKMPTGRNFLLGERPTQSSPLLHHLVLYACYNLPDEYLDMIGKEPNCNYETFANPCTGFVTEWAPGMAGRTFEPGYGKPFGTGHYEYVMFETHYNNPDGLKGEKDSASYEIIYNDKPVETEIGTLTLGDLQVSGWFLPPGKELVKHSTTCTPECTDRWPSAGITAVSVFHHMHYRGRNAEVRIVRGGKEISPLSTLRDFEYGYQFSKSLNSIQLLPGDRLITTCEYDTSNDTRPVPGGLPSEDEMCFAWVDYYPANNILACTQYSDNRGTAGLCMNSNSAQPAIYQSSFLTAPFKQLPVTGDVCPASGTGASSNDASVLQSCVDTDVCFSVNVPEETAASGSGDIFFQLSAPLTYSWVALAQGTMMSNANMFVMYSSADGNITLSPRHANNHVMPTFNDAVQISLLEGSGIVDGKMVANVRCENCGSWNGGVMSFDDTSSDWLYSHLSGPPIDSDDVNAVISQHDEHGTLQFDLEQATGGSSANPFLGGGTTTTTSSQSADSWNKLSAKTQSAFIQAHGALAAITFVAILPIGAMLMRLTSFHGLLWVHGGLQVFGYVVFTVAAGLGIFIANGFAYLNEPHAVIGMVLFGILIFMPIPGVIHHRVYMRVQNRTAWSYAHIFTGRVGNLVGIINGGLGLKLADASRPYVIAYGVIAGVMGITYIGTIVFGEMSRAKKSRDATTTSACTESKRRTRDDSGRDGS